MKPLYIVGTQRDIGKTTTSLGLAHAFAQRGLSVGYLKPLGQRMVTAEGHVVHDDAKLVYTCLGQPEVTQNDMAIPLPSGRVEKEIRNPQSDELFARVQESYNARSAGKDVVIVEAMGHVAMGSCLGLSAADVAQRLGARTLLISGGGIGRAIDEIALCSTFLHARGADFLGVIVNKVWPEKYDRVKAATTQGLGNLGIDSYGTMPFDKRLAAPTVRQVYEVIDGEILAGAENMEQRVFNTMVAAMESENMVRNLKESTLVISPGDREDNIIACLCAHIMGDIHENTLAGMILTGGLRPDDETMALIEASGVPVVLAKGDTYSVVSKYRETVFKIRPGDTVRIQAAFEVIEQHVNVDAILESLRE